MEIFDAAIDFLRKKGQKVSALRSERDAKEGVVIALANSAMNTGVIVNLSCETDFVAKNDEFVAFAMQAANLALEHGASSREQLLSMTIGSITVEEKIIELVGKIGEKIEIRRFESMHAPAVVPYIHSNYKLGVLVGFSQPVNEKMEAPAKGHCHADCCHESCCGGSAIRFASRD